ncbi:ABC transporter ATP-binding protein [Sporolactobacillus sp. CPB3-1]|uniref:ABC transporter ATP-binding protein n=1 Tax=Sporolactobacillus mangiferae TaxID=2940498 RepID=A0ABT0M9E8_9BACL|nr:ABC transporter ATP-binding protein [Sporolactobacillus mangiferae]MCL1631500.1 ABC transporter ATP-binding protein [Sporolactobacillus mangiferae]
MSRSPDKLLEVENLHVSFRAQGGEVHAVRGVAFDVAQGETLAIVGESGCGKSVTSLAVMGLIPRPHGKIVAGSIRFKGTELTALSAKKMRRIQGTDLSMIFQDPMTALNPTLTIGSQLTEGIVYQKKISRAAAYQRAIDMLEMVGLSNGAQRMKQYPHQFSGGMRQRIVIAMALICRPSLIIADEPTTALDVTIQAQILELFDQIQKETGVSMIMITHDLGVVAKTADRVAVMYAGKIVEMGSKRDIFYHASHPYTQALLNAIVRLDLPSDTLKPIEGAPPDLFAPPEGCSFCERCPFAMEVCRHVQPPATTVDGHHTAACWLLDKRADGIRQKVENY